MKDRRLAISVGVSLILMTIIAGYVFGYAYPEFYHVDKLELLKGDILSHQSLYKSMLVGIVLILILDIIVSYGLYKYFEDENRKISLAAGIIRVIYTVIFAIATYYLVINMNATELKNQTINSNFKQFQTIWNVGLVIFGFHILLIGWLMKLHQIIPKVIWYLTVFAGVCYLVVHLLKLTIPNSSLATNTELFLALPMALGEFGLAIWLLIKGGRKK